jgi:chromosome partitioning protein
MKKILIISQKGGSGKSTLACNLAVAFSKKFKITLLDADPQGSSLDWGNERKENIKNNNININYLNILNINNSINAIKDNKSDYVIIDTPPTLTDLQEELIKVADMIIIPLIPTKSNFTTIDPLLEIVVKHNKKYAFVLSNANVNTNLFKEVASVLKTKGEVLGTLKTTVKMQIAELDGLGIEEVDKNHDNVKVINNIVKEIIKKM